MADQKISQLTSLTGANTASGDLVTVVDISDTTMGASGTNKKMTLAEFQASPVSAGTANGVVYLNGTKVPSSGSVLTFDGTYFNANGLRLAGADVTNTIYQATGALGISTGSASGIIFSPNATARMALDASGNLGVGTVSPTQRLHVQAGTAATGNSAFFVNQDGTNNPYLQIQHSSVGVKLFNSSSAGGSANNLIFGNGSTAETMRLDASGNLGIGTASPTVKLHVSSTATEVIFQDSDTAKGSSLAALLSYHGSDGRAGYIGYPADSSLYIYNQNNTAILFGTNNAEKMRLDASGNLGLGVTPSAWNTSFYKAIQLAPTASIFGSTTTPAVWVGANTFKNSSNQDAYISSAVASQYAQVSGVHAWYTAPSGTAGNVISFTQAMTLDVNGNLFVNLGNLIVGQSGDLLQHIVRVYGDAGANKAPVMSFLRNGSREAFVAVLDNGTLGFGNTSGMSVYTDSAINAATQMVLDASGNLGVGTASPGVKLDVNGAARILAGSALYFQNAAANTNATISCTGGSGNNTMSFNSGAMLLDASGNLGLNTSTFGTSAAGVLSLGTGTAPTTGPADTVQLFSVDRSAGNTIPAIRCEGSGVTSAGITSTAVTNKIAVQVNGTIYYLLATTNAT